MSVLITPVKIPTINIPSLVDSYHAIHDRVEGDHYEHHGGFWLGTYQQGSVDEDAVEGEAFDEWLGDLNEALEAIETRFDEDSPLWANYCNEIERQLRELATEMTQRISNQRRDEINDLADQYKKALEHASNVTMPQLVAA